jgi:membrane-associated PAP2 superfamily phosphatase
MRRLASLGLAFALVALSLTSASLSHAQTSCSCPWEVVQLNCSGGYDCALNASSCQQNAGAWADIRCSSRGNACTYVYSPLGCTTNSDGTVTASGLINYKCNQC